MESVKLPAIDYAALAPMLILFGVACVGVIVEALVPRRSRHGVQLGLSFLAIVAAFIVVIVEHG
jgi:NADH-quinone oxidoreductase subunit N